jgi:hypothetical protein
MKKIILVAICLLVIWPSGIVFAATHSAGTNIKGADGTIYLVTTDGYKRPYTSAGAFLSYGLNSFAKTQNESTEDSSLKNGWFIPPQDGKIICSDRGADKGTCY